ncbi:MAG: hypothetical protein ACRDP6_13620 [Actinoallomurus sp.]
MSMPSARRSKRAGRTVTSAEPSADDRAGQVEVEEVAGRFLLTAAPTRTEGLPELIATLEPGDATLVVVAVPDEYADALWPRIGEVLARVRGRERRVVMAMSGAGTDRPDRAALARRIADTWELTVVAPSGDVVLAPGGSLFVHPDADGTEPQWWSFVRDTAPEALGPRWPVPEWRAALTDVCASPDGPVLSQVPAGVLVRPAGSPAPAPGDLAYAIPAAAERPTVLVGGADGAQVTADDLVAALSGPVARREWRRHALRLVPAAGGDLLPLGQAVARELGLEVEVFTGPPVEVAGGLQVVLTDADGHPTWSPFAASLLCRPPSRDGAVSRPRPLDWRSPVADMRVADAAHGVLRLGGKWRVAVTRAGLWAYPDGADPDRFPDRLAAESPADPGTVRIDVGTPYGTLDDQVWPLLDDLLGAVAPGPRARLRLVVHGEITAAGQESVQRIAARHDADLGPVVAVSAAAAKVSPVRDVRTSAAVPAPAQTAGTRPGTTAAPGHRSTDEERAAFRAMVGLDWDRHAAPIRRTFSRLPAIAATERAAAAVDLVAVRLYLTSRADGDFGPAAARSGGETLRPYLSCLASGLGRLPTYRGAMLHGVDAPVRGELTGSVLTEPGPVSGLPLAGEGADAYGWPATATVYVIWSDTARRVAALFDTETDSGTAERRSDVVFTPGSRFAVLDVLRGDADTPDLVLLRELPETTFPAGEASTTTEPPPGGRIALKRLNEALATTRPTAASAAPWPAHCLGPIGTPATTSGRATGT